MRRTGQSMSEESLRELQNRLQQFATDRDWDQFHNPKNLIMALTGELGELAEIFQWLTAEQATTIMEDSLKAEHVREELADVFGYVLRLASILDVDLQAALLSKITSNEVKYPIAKSRGSAAKYTELA